MFLLENSCIPQILSAIPCKETYKHGTLFHLFHITKMSIINPVRFQDIYQESSQGYTSCLVKSNSHYAYHTFDGRKKKYRRKKKIKKLPPCSNAFSKNY